MAHLALDRALPASWIDEVIQAPSALGINGLTPLDGAPEIYTVAVMTGTARQAG